MERSSRFAKVLLLAAERLELVSLDHLQLADGTRLMCATDLGDDSGVSLVHLFDAGQNSLLRSIIAGR